MSYFRLIACFAVFFVGSILCAQENSADDWQIEDEPAITKLQGSVQARQRLEQSFELFAKIEGIVKEVQQKAPAICAYIEEHSAEICAHSGPFMARLEEIVKKAEEHKPEIRALLMKKAEELKPEIRAHLKKKLEEHAPAIRAHLKKKLEECAPAICTNSNPFMVRLEEIIKKSEEHKSEIRALLKKKSEVNDAEIRAHLKKKLEEHAPAIRAHLKKELHQHLKMMAEKSNKCCVNKGDCDLKKMIDSAVADSKCCHKKCTDKKCLEKECLDKVRAHINEHSDEIRAEIEKAVAKLDSFVQKVKKELKKN